MTTTLRPWPAPADLRERATETDRLVAEMMGRNPTAVTMETADGFLVISRTRIRKSVVPPYRYDYHYDHFDGESDATEMYGEIERGEYSDSREPVAIVPCRKGVPLGAKKVL